MTKDWQDLGIQAKELIAAHSREPPVFWMALLCVVMMEVHDRITELESWNDEHDDDGWKR